MKTLTDSFREWWTLFNPQGTVQGGLGPPQYPPYSTIPAFYAGAAAMAEQFAAGQSKSAEILAEIRDELHKLAQIQGEIADG